MTQSVATPVATPRAGAWLRIAAVVLKPFLLLTTKRTWYGRENLPAAGGVIVVCNHNSVFDPLVVSHFVWDRPRVPCFLAKSSLFTAPVIGPVMRGARHIPVYRQSRDAGLALKAAVEAVNRGECVIIYPEGTTTKDPQLWPMVGKTGAARVALETGAPVIPLAQWGAPMRKGFPNKRFLKVGRAQVTVQAGPPVDLSDVQGQPVTPEVLGKVTDRLMTVITGMLAQIRQEQPPHNRYDPRIGEVNSNQQANA